MLTNGFASVLVTERNTCHDCCDILLVVGLATKKTVLDDQPPDLGVQLFYLRFARAVRFAAPSEHIRHAFDCLALPCAHLVRMHLLPRCDLLDRLVVTQRLKRDLGFELIFKLPAFHHLVSLQKVRDTP